MAIPPTLGSRTLSTLLQTIGTRLRADLQRHATEVTTGRAADPARALQGALGDWSVIEARRVRLGAETQALQGAALRAEVAQTALGRLADASGAAWQAMLPAATGEPDEGLLAQTARAARQALADGIAALNARAAGAAVFGGTVTDQGPLPGADAILTAVRAAVAGAPTAQDVRQRVTDLFLDAGGAYATTLYAGGAPAPLAAATTDGALPPLPTAMDSGVRASLATLALAALADDAATLPDLALRRGVARLAAEGHPMSQAALTATRAALGTTEGGIEDRRTRLGAEDDALVRLRQDRIGVDPYVAASRLESTRSQLETLHAVTARVSRLSLLEFLR